MDKHFKNWLIQAPAGLVLVGLGACLIAESALLKAAGGDTWRWVAAGTVSLSVFNAGLCIFGNSILERVRYERKAQPNGNTARLHSHNKQDNELREQLRKD